MLPNYDDSAACPAVGLHWPAAFAITIPLRSGLRAPAALITAPVNLDVQVANLLPQRVAVEAEEVGGADLVAPGRRQRGREQRHLDFLQNPVIKPRRRHAIGEPGEVRRQIGLDRAAEIVDAELDAAARGDRRRRQLAVN